MPVVENSFGPCQKPKSTISELDTLTCFFSGWVGTKISRTNRLVEGRDYFGPLLLSVLRFLLELSLLKKEPLQPFHTERQ